MFRAARGTVVLGKVGLILGFGIAITACLAVGISADKAARIALDDARSVEHWHVERVGVVREADPSEVATYRTWSPVTATGPGWCGCLAGSVWGVRRVDAI